MLKPLSPTDYRQLFCAALRSDKYIQIGGEDWYGNKVCALGVGVREGLFADVRIERTDSPRERAIKAMQPDFYTEATKKLAIDADDIYCKNDDGWTFEQIAVWIEKGAPQIPLDQWGQHKMALDKIDVWLASLPEPVLA